MRMPLFAAAVRAGVVGDRPLSVRSAIDYLRNKTSVNIFADDLDLRAWARDVADGEGRAGSEARPVHLVGSPVVRIRWRKIKVANLPTGIIDHGDGGRLWYAVRSGEQRHRREAAE